MAAAFSPWPQPHFMPIDAQGYKNFFIQP